MFTADQRAAYLAAIATGATQQKACADLGVSPRTVHHHTTRDPQFAEALTVAKEEGHAARLPHGASRYRKLGCRCPICVTQATAARIARRDRQRAREQGEEEPAGAEVHHLPVAAAGPPPLAAAGF